MSTVQEKLKVLCKRPYEEQSIWLLNAYWSRGPCNFGENPDAREKIWLMTNEFIALCPKGGKGCMLDQLTAHRFLEKNTEALTWVKLRKELAERKLDLFPKKVSLTQFYIHYFSLDETELVNSPQSFDEDGQKLVDEAKEAMANAAKAVDESKKREEQAEEAKNIATQKAKEARDAADDADAAHKAQLQAQKEMQEIAEQIKKEEEKKEKEIARLKAMSEDDSLGAVKKGKAFMNMTKLVNEDPLPLRKAKITQEAKVRKQKKATRRAKKTAKKAENAAAVAKEAEENAANALEASKQAVKDAVAAMESAEKKLEEVKSSVSGAGDGMIWYYDRQLEENRKYLPQSKQKAVKKGEGKKLLAEIKGKKKRRGLKKRGRKKGKSNAIAQAKVMNAITKPPKLKEVPQSERPNEDVPDSVKEAFRKDQEDEADEN